MAGFTNAVKIYEDPTINGDALEGILEPILGLTGTWDAAYGHVTRGVITKRVAGQTIQGIPNILVNRPMLVGEVKAVNGNLVTLKRGAAIGSGTIGKTLTKVTATGTVSALTAAVAAVRDTEGSAESRSIYDVVVTFSGAHGLAVGDFVGCEGLLDTDRADGIVYESHNKDHDPSCSIALRAAFDTAKLVGNPVLLSKFVNSGRDRDGVFFFITY